MFGLGFSEIVVVMFVALVAIGPKKLPGVAKAMGRGMAEFRNALDEMRTTVYKEVHQPLNKALNQQPELKETSSEYLDRLLAEREKERERKAVAEEPAAEAVAASADAIYAEAAGTGLTPDRSESGEAMAATDPEAGKA